MDKLYCTGRALVPHSHLTHKSGYSDCAHYTAYGSPWLMQIYVTSHMANKIPDKTSQREDNNSHSSSTNMQNYCSENSISRLPVVHALCFVSDDHLGGRVRFLCWMPYYIVMSVISAFPFSLHSAVAIGIQFSSSVYTGWDSSSLKGIISSFINIGAVRVFVGSLKYTESARLQTILLMGEFQRKLIYPLTYLAIYLCTHLCIYLVIWNTYYKTLETLPLEALAMERISGLDKKESHCSSNQKKKQFK